MKVEIAEVNVDVVAVDANAEVGRVSKVLAGLDEMEGAEASANRIKLAALYQAWQRSNRKVGEAKASRESKQRAEAMLEMLLMVVDGIRGQLGFLAPALSEQLPKKSKVDRADPKGLATSVIEVLRQGGPREQALAHDLRQMVSMTEAEQKKVKDDTASAAELEDQAKIARLNMREFESACERFIHENTPRGHKARAKLKVTRNRKPKVQGSEGQGQEPSASQPTPPVVMPAPVEAANSAPAEVAKAG